MKILTFDTSTDIMYVTLSENQCVKEYKILENTKNNYHTAYLIPVIVDMLQKIKLTMQDIDAVGVNIGPGSFTGIRASATVARVMGQNLNIPIIGISSLEILSCINNSGKNALCLLDARKGKAYAGLYDSNRNEIKAPASITYEEAIESAKTSNNFIISDTVMAEKLNDKKIESINYQNLNINFGPYLAELTYKKVISNSKNKYKWFDLKPLYIQPPPISMPKAVCN